MTKKTFSILAILIAGLTLGGCAYNPFLKLQPQDQGQPPQQGNSGEQSVKEESKIYSQPDGEYFFKYPSDWEAVPVNEEGEEHNQLGEKHVVSTRLSNKQRSLLIEIGKFLTHKDINRANVYWESRDAQTFYNDSHLVSVAAIGEGDNIYGAEFIFQEESGQKALFVFPKDGEGFFVNVKEGWDSENKEIFEKIIGSFTFSKDGATATPFPYCSERYENIVVNTFANQASEGKAQMVLKIKSRATGLPLQDIKIKTPFTKAHNFSGITDKNGEIVALFDVEDNEGETQKQGLFAEYQNSIAINGERAAGKFNILNVRLTPRARITLDVFLDENKPEEVFVLDNPANKDTFTLETCKSLDARTFGDDNSDELTLEEIKNAEYEFEGRKVRFVDGVRYLYDYGPGTSLINDYYVMITGYEDDIVRGDLNGDGLEDAAAIFGHRAGGTGSFALLGVILNDRGLPKTLPFTGLGDRTPINKITIEDGVIIIDMITHGPNDGGCCPTVPKILKFKVSGEELVEVLNVGSSLQLEPTKNRQTEIAPLR